MQDKSWNNGMSLLDFKKMLEDFDGQEGYNVAMYIDCIINIEELEEYLQSVYEYEERCNND